MKLFNIFKILKSDNLDKISDSISSSNNIDEAADKMFLTFRDMFFDKKEKDNPENNKNNFTQEQ